MKNIKSLEDFALNEAKNKFGNVYPSSDKMTKEVLNSLADKLKKLASLDSEKTEYHDADAEFNIAYNALGRVATYINDLKDYINRRTLEDNYPSYEDAVEESFNKLTRSKQEAMDFIKQM